MFMKFCFFNTYIYTQEASLAIKETSQQIFLAHHHSDFNSRVMLTETTLISTAILIDISKYRHFQLFTFLLLFKKLVSKSLITKSSEVLSNTFNRREIVRDIYRTPNPKDEEMILPLSMQDR